MRRRSAARRAALVWLPLLSAAALGGWLLLPSGHAGVASAAPTTAGVTGQGPATTASPSVVQGNMVGSGGRSAAVIYQQDCAACHGADGLGTGRAPSLAGVGEADVDFQLTTGRMPKKDSSAKMEPYTPILPGADIAALDQYVTALVAHGGPGILTVNPVAGNAAHGGAVFRDECAACHEWGGQGGVLYNRSLPKITEATPTQLGEALRVGPDQMPKFGPGEISDSEVNDIAAYLQELEHPYDNGGDPISHLGPFAEGAVVWLIGMVAVLFVARWIGTRG